MMWMLSDSSWRKWVRRSSAGSVVFEMKISLEGDDPGQEPVRRVAATSSSRMNAETSTAGAIMRPATRNAAW